MSHMYKYIVKELGFLPPPYGGVSVFLLRLISKLNSNGITAGGYYMGELPNLKNLPCELFDKWEWLNTRRLFSTYYRIRKQVRDYEIVHSHMSLEAMPFLWALSFFDKKKIVITIHNSMIQEFYSNTNFLNKFFLKEMAKRDVTWIAVSEEARIRMEQLPLVFRNTIIVIPAYIPIEIKETYELPLELETFLSSSPKVITFYGHSFMSNLGEDVYGFYRVIDMFACLSENGDTLSKLVYCIADKTEIDAIKMVQEYAKQKNVSGRIYWQIGPLANMQPLWMKTSVYVRPTSTDGDSVAVREALDLGVQVVASDVCIRPKRVAIYPLEDNVQFAKVVAKALKEGTGELNQNFSYYDQIVDVYKKLLK